MPSELTNSNGTWQLQINAGTTVGYSDGATEAYVDAKVLTETNARIAADIHVGSTAPGDPATGQLWLRTTDDVKLVVDFRAFNDGNPERSIAPYDDSTWKLDTTTAYPTHEGTHTAGRAFLDFTDNIVSFINNVKAMEIVNGTLVSPPAGDANTRTMVSIALTDTYLADGPFVNGTHRFTIGLADFANVGVLADSPTRTLGRVGMFGYADDALLGPGVEFRGDHADADTPIVAVRAIFGNQLDDTPDAGAWVDLTSLLGVDDRIALAVDFDRDLWWCEVNGATVTGTVAGAGTGSTVLTAQTLNSPPDSDIANYKSITLEAGAGADGWETGIQWASWTLHDYAPTLVTIQVYDGDAWQPVIIPQTAMRGVALASRPTP